MYRFLLFLALLMMGLTPLAVQATPICQVGSTGLIFGNYDPMDSQSLAVSGDVSVTCIGYPAESVSFEILINTGQSSSFTQRWLSNGQHRLFYNLYIDPPHTRIWGDGSTTTYVVGDRYIIGNNPLPKSYTLYGLIPARQNVSAGSYQDSLIITVNYQ